MLMFVCVCNVCVSEDLNILTCQNNEEEEKFSKLVYYISLHFISCTIFFNSLLLGYLFPTTKIGLLRSSAGKENEGFASWEKFKI